MHVNFRDGWIRTSAESTFKVFIPGLKERYEASGFGDSKALRNMLGLERPFCCLNPLVQSAILCSYMRNEDVRTNHIELRLDDGAIHFRVQNNQDHDGWELALL